MVSKPRDRFASTAPKTEILVLSMHYSDQLIRDILETGIRGYVVKSDSDRDLILAVEALANHKPFFTPHATELMLTNLSASPASIADGTETLKIASPLAKGKSFRLISEGNSSKQVATTWASASRPLTPTAPTSCANCRCTP